MVALSGFQKWTPLTSWSHAYKFITTYLSVFHFNFRGKISFTSLPVCPLSFTLLISLRIFAPLFFSLSFFLDLLSEAYILKNKQTNPNKPPPPKKNTLIHLKSTFLFKQPRCFKQSPHWSLFLHFPFITLPTVDNFLLPWVYCNCSDRIPTPTSVDSFESFLLLQRFSLIT